MTFNKITLFSALFTLVLLMSCGSNESNIQTDEYGWMSMNDIEAAVESNQKYTIVDVYTKWCGPCKMMDKNTFSDESIKKEFENFNIVKFDAEGPDDITFQGKTYTNPGHNPEKRGRNSKHELSNFFSVRGYPTLVVLDKDFKIVKKIVGYKKPEVLLPILTKIN